MLLDAPTCCTHNREKVSAVKTLAAAVVSVVNAIVVVIDLAVTGDWRAHPITQTNELLNFNYNRTRAGSTCDFDLSMLEQSKSNATTYNNGSTTASYNASLNFSGVCRECYAFAELTTFLDFTITDYKLQTFKSYMQGSVGFNLAVDKLQVNASVVLQLQRLMKTFVTPPLSVAIGPVTLSMLAVVPVSMGLDITTNGTATLAAAYTASASVTAGMAWDAVSNKTQSLDKVEYSKGGQGLQLLSLSGSAVATMWIMPVINTNTSVSSGPLSGKL
jgi:hypothetical protein